VLLRLGRSFSVMAEARGLVTGGIYRHIRHPLYLAEEIAAVGCAIQFFSLWALLLLCMQLGFQLRRMTNEERVLERRFPEYARYRQTTARLIQKPSPIATSAPTRITGALAAPNSNSHSTNATIAVKMPPISDGNPRLTPISLGTSAIALTPLRPRAANLPPSRAPFSGSACESGCRSR